jgi:hypothetical protein
VPLEINPLLEMGGTEKYGELIVHILYLVAFALGIAPIFLLIPKLGDTTIQIPQFTNQTFGDIRAILVTKIWKPINEMPISTFSQFGAVILTFIFLVFLAILIIFLIHNQIKEKKKEDLDRLEGMISYIDFFQPESLVARDRNQYLLYLYDKISNLHEWPIKKVFILEVFVSRLLLFISNIF